MDTPELTKSNETLNISRYTSESKEKNSTYNTSPITNTEEDTENVDKEIYKSYVSTKEVTHFSDKKYLQCIKNSRKPVFKEKQIEKAYGACLASARSHRLIVVGIVMILLNTMYDLPEWIFTAFGNEETIRPTKVYSHHAYIKTSYLETYAKIPLSWLLIPVDAAEVILQLIMAFSAYIPVLKKDTEKSVILLMLAATSLSAVRPISVLLDIPTEISAFEIEKWKLVTPIQSFVISTFLRCIVGSILVDLVCLIRRRQLRHFHRLMCMIQLIILLLCTFGGLRLELHFNFFVSIWAVGIAAWVVIGASFYGAFMTEVMHRNAYYETVVMSEKLYQLEQEACNQRASGKSILEHVVGTLKEMSQNLNTIEQNMSSNTIENKKGLQRIQGLLNNQVLSVLTSGRDMYKVNWVADDMSDGLQAFYGQYIAPYNQTTDPLTSEVENNNTFAEVIVSRELSTEECRKKSDFSTPIETRMKEYSGIQGQHGVYQNRSTEYKKSQNCSIEISPKKSNEALDYGIMKSKNYVKSPSVFLDIATFSRHDMRTSQDSSLANAGVWKGLKYHLTSHTSILQDTTIQPFKASLGHRWTIDMFELDRITQGNSLLVTGMILLYPHIERGILKCNPATLCDFLIKLQGQYHPNEYHNHIHGANVAHLTITLSRMIGLAQANKAAKKETNINDIASQNYIDEELILCLAALGHDVGHPGLNNSFLIATHQPIAIVYNDKAVLENYHAYSTFSTISQAAGEDGSILKGFSVMQYKNIRKNIIELILSTDMAQHFSTISTFRTRFASHAFSIANNEEDKWLLATLIFKAADIGHATVEWDQHQIWSLRVAEEFYFQGDMEVASGLTVSPLCDRTKASDLCASQHSFLEYIVQPLIKEIENCFEIHTADCIAFNSSEGIVDAFDILVQNLQANMERWKLQKNDKSTLAL